ncbi:MULTISPECIES: META domain-containing protein [unclassified Pseudoalteromonas]|uniref:META domain-containing protein n=1 Tax=unclassified Pseudoalteromonas TaxID=194690 RepID=UPI002097CEC6|nr:META domain-containing protein [Pseudoalteromonas sp. XMcav2-N]MCO7189829.1 META domain-containing protein [Pseudoalteromonas sp. XMcav2-N]
MKISILLCLMCVLLMACSSTGKVTREQLKHSHWQLIQVDGHLVKDASPIEIEFLDALQVVGFAGCNRFFAEGNMDSEVLTLSKLGMTRKSCGSTLDNQEVQFLEMLQQGASVTFVNSKLQLKGEQTWRFKALDAESLTN